MLVVRCLVFDNVASLDGFAGFDGLHLESCCWCLMIFMLLLVWFDLNILMMFMIWPWLIMLLC